jgi:signal transduction histidine kinase
MAARLDALLFGSRAVVADVSHQLRTPLAAMRLRLELLRGELGGAGDEDLAAALGELDRLSRLVDGLLAVARAENADVAPVPVDVARLAGERRDAWQPIADEREIEIAVEGDPVWAAATPGHIEQVVDNLQANAIDAVAEHGHVALRVGQTDGRVVLAVVDDGPGMTEEQRAGAFHRFVTGRPGGAGLGLAIVHRHVTADGGSVSIDSTPGHGTTVRLELPKARSRHGAAAHPCCHSGVTPGRRRRSRPAPSTVRVATAAGRRGRCRSWC